MQVHSYIAKKFIAFSLCLQVYKWAENSYTVHGEILAGEKLVNVAKIELFTKNFLTNIHIAIHSKMYLAYISIGTDFSLFTKCFLANSFYLYGPLKISPIKFSPCSYGIKQYSTKAIYMQMDTAITRAKYS